MPAALRCNELAVSLAPRNAIYHYNLAATQRFLGRLEEAEESYNRALALDPHEYEAYLMRAELFKRTEDNNYTKEIKRRLSIGVRHWRGEVQLCFALAKEFEDLSCFDESFAYLKRGADLKRRKSDYDLGADIATIDRIIETYATQLFRDSGAGYDSHEAIFVLGMPRTGTTLVERILGCHSEVQSVGESNNFAIEMVKLVRQSAPNQRLMRSELIAASANVDLSKLGQNYIESTRPKSGTYRFFVDKLPANYLYCGLISLALPNAKIISLVRDPMDTCYSVYKTLFKSAYPFSYDLEEMARYFVAYQRLMAHWHQLLPGKMLDVQYEDLVADQEGQTRRILEHCGLSWEPNVLDFHTSTEATTTASAVQVRQPIYASSIGKWRRFENQLRPAANILTDAGIQFS